MNLLEIKKRFSDRKNKLLKEIFLVCQNLSTFEMTYISLALDEENYLEKFIFSVCETSKNFNETHFTK
jgi:hypothetical protein